MKKQDSIFLTESEKIDIELIQAFDICCRSVPDDKWELYNEASKNSYSKPDIDFETYSKNAVETLVSKNFDAVLVPGNGITIKINTFKTCFTIESVPSLQKKYNSNLKRTANTYYNTNKGTDSTIKTYKNMGTLFVKPLDMALRFESEEGVLAEIQRTESNIIAANNDINITPKLATSKAKPGLLKVFEEELKYWHEVHKIAEETDYKDLALQKECDNTPEIEAFTKNWNNSGTRDTHNTVYLNERKVFDWFKFYDIKPVNDIDTVLQMYYANEIKDSDTSFNGYMQCLNDNANELQKEINEAYNTKGKLKNSSHRERERIQRKKTNLENIQEQIKFLAYNKSEIETLIQKHGQLA